MLIKLFWLIAVALYGSAALLAAAEHAAGLDYRFWILIALGTLSAVLGNILSNPAAWDQDGEKPHAPRH